MSLATTQGKGRNIFVAIFFSFTALFSLLALVSSVIDMVKASNASTWPVVDGVVISSQVRRGCKNMAHYLPSVNYRYTVKGHEYVGGRIAFGANICGSESHAATIASAYPQGKVVSVHFDPTSPNESTLIEGRTEDGIWLAFIFAPLILAVSLPSAYHYASLCLTSQSTRPAQKGAQAGDFDIERHNEARSLSRLLEFRHCVSCRRPVPHSPGLAPRYPAIWPPQPPVPDRPSPRALCHVRAPANHPLAEHHRSHVDSVRHRRRCLRSPCEHLGGEVNCPCASESAPK
jgi:uncharacterized protein DUF3592